jgi:uncharacterized protein
MREGDYVPQRDAPSTAGPIAPHDRVLAIDVLRGLALLGVLAMNIATEFRVSIFQRFLPAQPHASWVDRTIDAVLMVGIDLKALALFSFLLGVGLAIQFDHLSGGSRRPALLLRRLSVLLIIGVLHLTLIWNGDILVEYALAGLVVLPFLFGSRRLLAVAAALGLSLYVVGPLLPLSPPLPSTAWMAHHVTEAVRVYGSGGFADILAFRVRELPAILPLHVAIFPRTLALMLLGALAWRAGVFHSKGVSRRQLLWTAAAGTVLGGAMAVAVAARWLGAGAPTWMVERASTVVLACGYGAGIIWAVDRTTAAEWLAWAAPVGRMALTNYLMQSVILGYIFYGYGLGLFGRLGLGEAMAIGICVYVAQTVFSGCWLRRYSFGPAEWIWRTATYGAAPPLRRHS